MIIYYSQLFLNGHVYTYKMDTLCWSCPCHFTVTPYKTDTSLRWTVGAGPDGVHLRES